MVVHLQVRVVGHHTDRPSGVRRTPQPSTSFHFSTSPMTLAWELRMDGRVGADNVIHGHEHQPQAEVRALR